MPPSSVLPATKGLLTYSLSPTCKSHLPLPPPNSMHPLLSSSLPLEIITACQNRSQSKRQGNPSVFSPCPTCELSLTPFCVKTFRWGGLLRSVSSVSVESLGGGVIWNWSHAQFHINEPLSIASFAKRDDNDEQCATENDVIGIPFTHTFGPLFPSLTCTLL